MAKKYPGSPVKDRTLDKIKLAQANDKYNNEKRIDDAIHWMLSGSIRTLPFLGLACIIFIVWYYLFSPKSNIDALFSLCLNVLIYLVGILTPMINQRLRANKQDNNESL